MSKKAPAIHTASEAAGPPPDPSPRSRPVSAASGAKSLKSWPTSAPSVTTSPTLS